VFFSFSPFVEVPPTPILVYVCHCVCSSRKVSSYILNYECDISVCVISVCWVCVCISVSLTLCCCFCWRTNGWCTVCIPGFCPEIQVSLVSGCVLGCTFKFIGCSLCVFLTLCRLLVAVLGSVWDWYCLYWPGVYTWRCVYCYFLTK
jgi:hypothetical protein